MTAPAAPASLYPLLAFCVSALVVVLTTPLVRSLGLQQGLVDQPGERKVHHRPMVRLGGISIFLGSLAALLLTWWLGGFGVLPPDREYEIWGVTIGGLVFFLIGLADDFFSLSPITRLLAQLAVASGVWLVGVRIDLLTIPFVGGVYVLPEWLSLPVTVIWLVGMTNAINWIDGLDGLAAGVSGISAVILLIVALAVQQPAAALVAAALAGGCLGFLRYNFNPAKIFMGDGGSYFIGFTLAGVGVIGLVKSLATVAVLLPFLILAVPLLDMVTVIFDRLRSGQSPFKADKRHLHHRLLDAGFSHRRTVVLIYGLTLCAGSWALAFANIPSGYAYAIASTLLVIVLFVLSRRRSRRSLPRT
ncbi:glycosyltransferase family 4 protein [Synechococcus elongatus]|uniref:MraY family glycosyltransferase n=1 Tax=Synechococcus elongatus PCC 11801 TaxID=2219813 RepID=A0AAN1UTC8_SYNEL|nr:MraY family glycosyltransferase [Synechococcus elongatus]AZB71402.1 undecaprenyl/decaprenyl-phosphate alpha-N-acetylglucosaminyl 1-phosphate transferase [Synechococcus elongatus PCC 11801]